MTTNQLSLLTRELRGDVHRLVEETFKRHKVAAVVDGVGRICILTPWRRAGRPDGTQVTVMVLAYFGQDTDSLHFEAAFKAGQAVPFIVEHVAGTAITHLRLPRNDEDWVLYDSTLVTLSRRRTRARGGRLGGVGKRGAVRIIRQRAKAEQVLRLRMAPTGTRIEMPGGQCFVKVREAGRNSVWARADRGVPSDDRRILQEWDLARARTLGGHYSTKIRDVIRAAGRMRKRAMAEAALSN